MKKICHSDNEAINCKLDNIKKQGYGKVLTIDALKHYNILI